MYIISKRMAKQNVITGQLSHDLGSILQISNSSNVYSCNHLMYAYHARICCSGKRLHTAWYFLVSFQRLTQSSGLWNWRPTPCLKQHWKRFATALYHVHPKFETALMSKRKPLGSFTATGPSRAKPLPSHADELVQVGCQPFSTSAAYNLVLEAYFQLLRRVLGALRCYLDDT